MNLNAFLKFLENISKFQLEYVSKEWVDYTWSSEFPSPLEIPSDYELQVDVNFIDLIREVRENLRTWLEEEVDANTSASTRDSLTQKKSWNALAHQINHRTLLCLLSAFISQYNHNPSFVNDDVLHVNARAFEAARFYFMLISIDGAHIFQIFQGVIYRQCLDIFKSLASFNSHAKVSHKGRGRKKPNRDDCEELHTNGDSVSPVHIKEFIIKPCCSLINDLCFCLKKFSLSSDEGELNFTIQTMFQVAGCERYVSSFLNHKPSKNTTSYLAYKAYSVIETLCDEFHGTVSNTLKDVMRTLLPCLCIYDPQFGQNLSKENITVKDHSINFIIKLVKMLKDVSHNAVYTLVQQLCVRVPDKAEIRTKYIDIIIDLIFQLPYRLYYRTVLFLCSLCFSEIVKHRLVGIETVARILSHAPKVGLDDTISSDGCGSKLSISSSKSSVASTETSDPNFLPLRRFLFALIVNRCKDISPRMRIKTLSILSNLLRSSEIFVVQIIEEIFIFQVDNENKDLFDFNKFFRKKSYEEPLLPDTLPTAEVIISLIETLTHDSKALVRKNALHVISDICLVHQRWITQERLSILVSSCKDLSVGNRKLMAQCLTDLLERRPDCDIVINGWVDGVVPLFAENEVKSQEKVLELASSIILDNIVPANKVNSPKDRLPWKIIALISKRDMRKLFRFACQQWCSKEVIKDHLIKCLQTYIGTDCNFLAWYFLVCISEFQNLPNPEKILKYFYENVYNQSSINELECQLVMQALVLNWKKLERDQIDELCAKLRSSLQMYETPLSLISGSLDIVHLNDRQGIKDFAEEILLDCQERIKQRVKAVIKEECYSDTLLCRYIFMLGEVSQICPDRVDLETINTLANLIDLANIDPANLEKDLTNFGFVQATTVTTLGRLCLQNQFTAKAVVPILGALVSAKTPSAIKNNANIALTDLCIRFSSLVEPFFGDMFVCLKDPDPVIRRNTLSLICILIQEQYLKLKAHIFIYLLSMLHDESSEIKDYVSSFLVNSLMAKDANIVFTHFIQGIFFLNCYEGASSITERISPQEKSIFCLPGEENTLARRDLLLFLLQHMDDVMKFKTKYRICIEILHPIAEGTIQLDGKGVIILKDSLYILGCDEIKMNIRKGGKDGEPEDEVDEVADAVAVVKKNVMSQLYSSLIKKNLTENIIPIIKSLKQKLQSLRSPLVIDVMECLREILKDFSKDQVEEILAADPELAAEVIHDIQRESEEAGSNQCTEDQGISSPQDPVMEQMAQVAKRISCRVMLHGPESITTGAVQGDVNFLENGDDGHVDEMITLATPLRGSRSPRGINSPRHSSSSNDSPRNSFNRLSNGNASTSKNEMKNSKDIKGSRSKRSESSRSERSNSVMSDRSDSSTSISSLSCLASSSSSSSSASTSRRRKR